MLKNYIRIFIVLFAVGVYGSANHQPTTFIKETKIIGSLHENEEVEMFIGLPFAVPPLDDLRWEKPIAWIPKLEKEIIADKFKPACF